MHVFIDRDFMRLEVKKILEYILNLPELEEVDIKGNIIASREDEQAITKAINACYHDMYSDVDISMHIKLNPHEYNGDVPIYAACTDRLGLDGDILGLLHHRLEDRGELLRICKTNGMRYDLRIYAACTGNVPRLPHNNVKEELQNIDRFWFVAIQALGKLMRKDHLIASHLAHALLQESLAVQMVMRDNKYNTNFHRYGYGEELDYLPVFCEEECPFAKSPNATCNYISRLIYSAVTSYDRLCSSLFDSYESRAANFFAIWSCYCRGMV